MVVARDVIDARHGSFKEEPEAERLQKMSPRALYRTIKEIKTPRSGVTSAEPCSRSYIDRLKKIMTENDDS